MLDGDELADGAAAGADLRLVSVAAVGGSLAGDASSVVGRRTDDDVGTDEAVLAAVGTVVQVEVPDGERAAEVDLPPLRVAVLGVGAGRGAP